MTAAIRLTTEVASLPPIAGLHFWLAGPDPVAPRGAVFAFAAHLKDAALALDRLGRGAVAGLADDHHPVHAEQPRLVYYLT
ncbi:hypothetical protein [Arthrobacter rhizosphaerae]|uniref:hypothetical protein n=1 Tax=Arthrobacter rhizosphaerae TaxID=2855490 RepID=UPI001FF3682D|nr:hypothetical protein [Arthrobacter rhizosphaerae]